MLERLTSAESLDKPHVISLPADAATLSECVPIYASTLWPLRTRTDGDTSDGDTCYKTRGGRVRLPSDAAAAQG